MMNPKNIRHIGRRALLAYTMAIGTLASTYVPGTLAQGSKTGVDLSTWTPSYIKSIAGTAEYDTAAECYRIDRKSVV